MTTTPHYSISRSTFIVRSLAVGVALLVAGSLESAAQYLPGYAIRAIDSAMAAVHVTRSDMAMRWDATAPDPHRLGMVKRLFGTPLASFSVADSLASIALANRRSYAPLMTHAGRLLDLGDAAFIMNRALMSDNEIKLYSKIDVGRLSLPDAFLLRKFLTLALTTDAAIINAKAGIVPERLKRLVEYCDSLILQSEDDANATLVELKAAERYGLKRNKIFFNEDAAGLDYAQFLEPGASMFAVSYEHAQNMATEVERLKDSIKTQIWQTPLGLIALGGAGDDIYSGDLFCIVDVGGNDIYRPKPRTKLEAAERPVQLIVDFEGNDTYIGTDYTLGGTLFGASVLLDLEGDDSYSARNFGLGCGYFGTGILYDGSGSDRYAGGTGVEGAGFFGIGLLIDAKGNDNYLAHLESQGFGYTRGLGGIVDHEGNDSYMAASPYTDYLRYDDHYETFSQGAALGARPVASAGIGFIAEGGGNDIYIADIYGQGTAYWYGLGAIVDYGGNDTYSAFQYAQGAGVHLAFGTLIDTAGNDNYMSHGVSQGCGHDIAFGGLYDAKGDDNYVIESLSLGGGNANAVSLFIDGGGADGYIARVPNTMGYSDLRREYGMIGVFLDLDGKDFYGSVRGGNDSLWTGSTYGAGLDANMRPKSPDDPTPGAPPGQKKTKEEIEAELAKDISTLFIQASAAPQKYQYIVEPARAKLVERADESIPYLLDQLNSESARERLALGILLPRIGSKVMGRLIDTVLKGDISRVGMAIYALGEMKDTVAGLALGQKIADQKISWRLRASAGEALLKMRAESAKPFLKLAVTDSFELVRAYAARAYVMVADSAELLSLMPMLNDRSQIVRYQIQLGLQRRGLDTPSIANAFAQALAASNPGYRFELLASVATSLKDSGARVALLSAMLANQIPQIRARAVRLAAAWNDPALIEQARAIKKKERNSLVLYELGKLPESAKRKRDKKKERDA